jgi:hypothetical protein
MVSLFTDLTNGRYRYLWYPWYPWDLRDLRDRDLGYPWDLRDL